MLLPQRLRDAFAIYSLLLASLLAAGCSSKPSKVELPRYDPEAFATAIVERCDADKNGAISKQEAEQAPGIVAAWARYDANNDGSLSRDELVARAKQWSEAGLGLASVRCVVRLNGAQVDGVLVKLVPDEALADILKPAECTSASQGASVMMIPAELQPADLKGVGGMQFGLYTVEVSHPQMKLEPAPNSRGRDIDRPEQSAPVMIDVVRK
jgi:EF hand